MLVSWAMVWAKDEGCGGRWFRMAKLPVSWKMGKEDLRSGPGWQKEMQIVLTTHLHVTLMPSHLENSDTHTHRGMKFFPHMPFIMLQKWRCKLL